MNASQFLTELREKGISIEANGNNLKITAPSGCITPQLQEAIFRQKPRLLSFFKDQSSKASGYRNEDKKLSFAQQEFWLLEQMGAGNASTISCAIHINGPLNSYKIKQSLGVLVSRHRAFHIYIYEKDHSPQLEIAQDVSLPFEELDCQQHSQADIVTLTHAMQRYTFNLASAPLLKVVLLKIRPTEWRLLVSMHHIIADDRSFKIFFNELVALYQGKVLPKLEEQGRAGSPRDSSTYKSSIEFWLNKFSVSTPQYELPIAKQTKRKSFNGARQHCLLEDRQSGVDLQYLDKLAGKHCASRFMVLLAVLKLLLYRYTGQPQQSIGTVVSTRRSIADEATIGCFINTIAIRSSIDPNKSIDELICQVRKEALDAYTHAQIPLTQLTHILKEKYRFQGPLFQVTFINETAPQRELKLDEGIYGREIDKTGFSAKVDFCLLLVQRREGLSLVAEYNSELYSDKSIARFLQHYRTLLANALASPSSPCQSLAWITNSEISQWHKWGRGELVRNKDTLTTLLRAQVIKTPHNVALSFQDQQLTYQELQFSVQQLAHQLSDWGIVREELVGIYCARGIEFIIAMFALFEIGASYVPIDCNYPAERVRLMIEDSGIAGLLTQQQLAGGLRNVNTPKRIFLLDFLNQREGIKKNWFSPATTPCCEPACEPGDIANIIYTSGSTGRPKGVEVTHRGLANLALAQIKLFRVTGSSRVLQFSSTSFDASVSEILMALFSGATLCLATQEDLMPGPRLYRLLLRESITTLTLPPHVLALLPENPLPALQTLIVAGDRCPPESIEFWSADRSFYNAYGPTENSVCATVEMHSAYAARSSIGHPISGVEVYLLDNHLHPVPVGVPGEIHLGGVGLARGYRNRPTLTREKFIINPFQPQAKLYKTGDLAYYTENGRLIFLGRKDYQIKVRGYRVELGELESHFRRHPRVSAALAIPFSQVFSNDSIAVYVVANADDRQSLIKELRAQLKSELPDYMQPSTISIMDALPITANGKIDNNALQQIRDSRNRQAGEESAYKSTLWSSTERTLLNIWQQVLPNTPIAPDDNFFDLGGHSLLAVKLAALVHETFSIEIGLPVILDNPDIESLAKFLTTQSKCEWSPIQTLKKGGRSRRKKAPLFLIHPLGGNVMGYIPLVKYLPDDRPVYGLQAPGVDERHPPINSMKKLATHYIEAIQPLIEKGTIMLAGHSFGGLVAFEMAQQLVKKGRVIDFLLVMDTPAPVEKNRPPQVEDDAQWLWRRCMVIKAFTGIDISFNAEEFVKLSEAKQMQVFLRTMQKVGLLPKDSGIAMVKRLIAVQKASHEAICTYQPKPYTGKLYILRAEQLLTMQTHRALSENYRHPLLDWQNLCPEKNINIANTPGDHISMLTEPNVALCARKIADWMDNI